MKRTMKRLGGAAAAAVGIAGTILAVVATIQMWKSADHFARSLPPVLDRLEAMVDAVHQQGEATVSLLEMARQRVKLVGDSIEELAASPEEGPTPEARLRALEGDLGQRLEHAEEFVLSMQTSLRSMSGALLLLDSLPFFSPRIDPVEGPRESPLTTGAANLTEAADLLEQVTEIIVRIRTERTVAPAQIAQARQTLANVDRNLHEIQAEIGEFSQRAGETGAQLAAWKENLPKWINRSAVVATLFLVCFGCSQISLLVHGWQLLR